jgi:hypothetical protein
VPECRRVLLAREEEGEGVGRRRVWRAASAVYLWRERSVILLAGTARHEDSESIGR